MVHSRCAGIDIGKEYAKVCVRVQGGRGRKTTATITHCASMTNDILDLLTYLVEQQVTAVAMESTSDYWKPYYYVLEGHGFEMLLANANSVKAIKGRKSDVSDAAWLADLCAHGLIEGSFVPPPPVRKLRDYTRTRVNLTRDCTREMNRLEKRLESPGIKLSVVVSRIGGVSARRILRAMAGGERDPRVLANLAVTQIKNAKLEALIAALTGRFTDHDGIMVSHHLDRIEQIEEHIAKFDRLIEEAMAPFRGAEELLCTVPGVNKNLAQAIIAEMGADISVFPTAAHLASWGGFAPGIHESAGRLKNVKTKPGNSYFKGAVSVAVLSSARRPNTRLGARYRRLAKRRGKSRAIVAVGNTISVIIWHMFTTGETYREIGPNPNPQPHHDERKRRALRTLSELGYDIPELTLKTPA